MNHDVVSPWIALGVYVAGFAVTARIVFATNDGEDSGEDRLAAVCVGLIWPLVLAVCIVAGLVTLPTLGVKTRYDRRVAAEQQRQQAAQYGRQQAARIAELEAENERLRTQQEVS